jgi:hypothetical protein
VVARDCSSRGLAGFDPVIHEDWRVGDPVDASIDEVRRIRDGIERRVNALLDRLGVETVDQR